MNRPPPDWRRGDEFASAYRRHSQLRRAADRRQFLANLAFGIVSALFAGLLLLLALYAPEWRACLGWTP